MCHALVSIVKVVSLLRLGAQSLLSHVTACKIVVLYTRMVYCITESVVSCVS
jgi:hypothetical protein